MSSDIKCSKCNLKYCSLCYKKCPRHGVGLQPNMDRAIWENEFAYVNVNHNDHKDK